MTVLVQIKTKPDELIRPTDWMPWLNVTDGATVTAMAAAKFVRERGGVLPEERPFDIYIYRHFPKQRKHPDGSPAEVMTTHMRVG